MTTPFTAERGRAWSLPQVTDAEFRRFRELISSHTGIELRETKRHLLLARLVQRLRQLGLETLSEYYDYLVRDSSGTELPLFINRITTNQTSFFREPHHFEHLRRRVIPLLREAGERRVRIWSAGCSSGEEPYSIAITLREALGAVHGWDIRILASDIDTDMLSHAATGVYTAEALASLPEDLRRKYFLRGYGSCAGSVQVRQELRALVDFRRINLVEESWPVRAQFDAVFCRNVIIYFNQTLQRRIVERLVGYLKPAGTYFAGHSENLYWMRDVVEVVEPTVYRPVRTEASR